MKRNRHIFEHSRPVTNGSSEQAPIASSSTVSVGRTTKKTKDLSRIPQVSLNQSLETFDLQARDLISQCLMSDARKKDVQDVITDLTNCWKMLLPDFRPILFGSVANGLAMETSDIDCFVASEAIPDGAERIKFLLNYWRVMFKGGRFHNVITIRSARIPLVKAIHSRTGIEIDLSCSSDGALINSPLINYLVHQDIRVRDLVILVSFFYRLNNLVGTNRFVSYSVTWLVVFYLQNLENAIVPPLSRLLSFQANSRWPLETDDGRDLYRRLSSGNTSTLAELFCGYFRFYHSFDFTTMVVSPYLGYGIPSDDFESLDNLPMEFDTLRTARRAGSVKNNFNGRFVCIQDPIEHHLNSGSCVGFKVFHKFVKLNEAFFRLMMGSPHEVSWLEQLMGLRVEEEMKQDGLKSGSSVTFSLQYLPFKGTENLPESIARLRRDLTCAFELLLMSLTELETEPEVKMTNLQAPFDSHPAMAFEVKSLYNVFAKRFRQLYKRASSDPSSIVMVSKEHERISRRMKQPTTVLFHCMMIIKPPTASGDVEVVLTDMNENDYNSFAFVSEMLKANLGRILKSVGISNEKVGESAETKTNTTNQTTAPSDASVPVPIPRGQPFVFTVPNAFLADEDPLDPWGNFKRHLTAVFELLLFSYREVPSTTDDRLVASYEVHSNFNVFTKRFNYAYLSVICNARSGGSVRRQFIEISQKIKKPLTSFHSLLTVTEALHGDGVVITLLDVNDNVHNNFNHVCENLQSFLPDLVRAARDSDL